LIILSENEVNQKNGHTSNAEMQNTAYMTCGQENKTFYWVARWKYMFYTQGGPKK